MKTYEAESIFTTLEKAGKAGCDIVPLSKETKIKPSKLRRYLSHYSDFFTKADSNMNYKLNTSSRYNGSTRDMLKALKKERNTSCTSANFDLYDLFPIITLAVILLGVLKIYH